MLLSVATFAQTEQSNNTILTPEEIEWIKEHPTLKATNEMDFGPIDFMRAGKPAGFSIDYLNLVASKVGLNIEYVNGYLWEELIDQLRKREIDITHTVGETEDRLNYLNFTEPYVGLAAVYYGKIGSPEITSYQDLKDLRIGAVKGWLRSEIYRDLYPEFNVIEYETIQDAIRALTINEIDTFPSTLSTMEYIISKNFITGIEVIGNEFLPGVEATNEFHIAARNDEPLLISILQKGMNLVTEEEYLEISNRWLSDYRTNQQLNLSDDELDWLANNKVIKVAIEANAPPYQYIDENGNISGINRSYLDKISEELNIDFVWAQNETWAIGLEQVESGEADMFSIITPTEERKNFLSFTKPYLSAPFAIFSREREENFNNMDSLNGYSVVQIKGSAIVDFIRHDYPGINVLEAESLGDALQMVSNGDADAYTGDIPTTNHFIVKNGLTNILVKGQSDYEIESSMGIRTDLPHLTSAIEKVLAIISEKEKARFANEWFSLRIETEPDYDLIIQIIIGATIAFAIVLIWVAKLKTEIKRRRKAEEAMRISQEHAEAAQEEAEYANQIKSAFLANMSHEVRTPLNAIIGFSEVMTSGIFGDIGNDKYKNYIDDISFSSKHLKSVIDDILDLSKIEAGKWALNEREFELDQCIENALKMLDFSSDRKHINLHIHEDSITGVKIYGDDLAIQRVLTNLASNSIKYTNDGGEVNILVNYTDEGDISMTVNDTGVGIPEDRIEQVLHPFEQINENQYVNEEGTGLGLSIVNQLIKLHQGDFILKSEVGVGTSASVILPKSRLL